MRYNCFIDLKEEYRFSKELLGAVIPIEINNVKGNLYMPNSIENEMPYYKDLFGKTKCLGSEDSSVLLINEIYCEFDLDTIDDEIKLHNFLRNKLYTLSSILGCYPNKILNKNIFRPNEKAYRIDFSLWNKDKKITGNTLIGRFDVNAILNKNDCIGNYTLLKILLLIKNNAKTVIEYRLLWDAKEMLDNNDYRNVIINCCTIFEVVFSKLLIQKLTKNGSKKEDIEKILNNINGIAALGKLLKEFNIKTIKADFSNLAGLRNKAAHMGISPKNTDCNKYIKDCEELLQYHRIKFYEILK